MGDQVIKIIVKSESKGDEKVYIRHFMGSNTYFEDFKKKIITRFPYLREKEYKLYWIDGDLDQISIFYEEDFRIFIENFDTAKNRIYVEQRSEKYVKFIPTTEPIVTEGQAPPPVNQPNFEIHPKHKHVICDGCQTEIVGMRYKCLECKDFDICMLCEQKMIHRDHTMLRFYIPAEFVDWSNVRYDKFVRKFKHHGKHHEFPSKIEITVENENEPQKDNQEKCEGRRQFKRGGRHHGNHHKGGQHSNFWLNMMKYMNDLANQDYTVPSPNASPPPAQEPTPRTCFKTEQAFGATTTQENKPDVKETFENYNLANLINMITKTTLNDVVNAGINHAVGNIINATTPLAGQSSEVLSETTKIASETENTTNVVLETNTISVETAKLDIPEPIKEPEVTISQPEVAISQPEILASRKTPRSMDSTPDPDEKEWDVIDEEIVLEKLQARRGSPVLGAIPKEVPTNLKNMSTNTSSNDISTLISFEENSAPQNTNIASSAQTSIKSADEGMPDYAKLGRDLQRHIQEQMSALQDNEKEIYHKKPHVNSAVITMMAMGFSNEGGWLTQLLESVDGNISKALDLLQPNNK